LQQENYTVYIKADAAGRIIAVNSSAFLQDTDGWMQVPSGEFTVYMHENKLNKKKYIGITKQKIEYRWRSDGSGYFRSPYFWNAIQKYGWGNFEHIILHENVSAEYAKKLEVYYIGLYKTTNKQHGYNMTLGGDGSSGFKKSAESVEKTAAAHRGKKLSPEHKEILRQANIGKQASEETRKKLRESHLGKKLSPYAKERSLFLVLTKTEIKLNLNLLLRRPSIWAALIFAKVLKQ